MIDASPTGVYTLIDRIQELDAQRAELRAQLAAALDEATVEEAVGAFWKDAPLPRMRRPRPGRPGQTPDGRSLAQLLEALLAGRTMGINQLVHAAQAAGYRTKARHFRCIVYTTLCGHPRRFRRVGWGKYTAVGPGSTASVALAAAAEPVEQYPATG